MIYRIISKYLFGLKTPEKYIFLFFCAPTCKTSNSIALLHACLERHKAGRQAYFPPKINISSRNPVVIVPTLLGSVNAWRNFTFSSGVCLGFKAQVRLKIIKVSSVSIGNDGAKSDRTRKETDAYFDQLNSAWI